MTLIFFNISYDVQLKNIKIQFIFNDGDNHYNKIRTYCFESKTLPLVYIYTLEKLNTLLHTKMIIID